MSFDNLLTKKENGIGWIFINRPEKLNALNKKTIEELKEAFLSFDKDKEVKIVLFTGSGDKAFIAGADIKELSQMNKESGCQYVLKGQEVTRQIENMSKPVIAIINGYALGGGTEFALSCHIRIASENTKMGQPEVKLGLIPGFGGTQRLARLVGKGMAMELILSGKIINAEEALRIGLVNKVVQHDKLHEICIDLANEIMKNSPSAISLSIEAINKGLDKTLDEGLNLEAELFGDACATEDSNEGTQAFLEKRKADFKGL